MIAFYDAQGDKYPLQIYEDYSITHEEDGCDTMTFSVPVKHEQYKLLHEECRVEDGSNIWLIKKIDDDKFDCELDFDFLKGRIYQGYKSETRSLHEVLVDHLPSDWTIDGDGQSTIRRSIEFDFCNDYDVVYECMNTYKVRFMWRMKERRLIVIDPENTPYVGQYLTTELNLKNLSFKGDTTDFCTRLYCYGKDGVAIIEDAQVDDGSGGTKRYGLPYVEDRSYADKVVCAYWSDDRYTVPESMYEDAVEKLKDMANPVQSFECDVVDLAKMSPDYAFLGIEMHYRMMLIDPDRGMKVEHRVVRYKEYPDENYRNAVTLSCVPGTIQRSLKGSIQSLTEQTERRALAAVAEASARLNEAMQKASGLYPTAEIQPDGSTVWLLHDKRELSESTVVIKIADAGIGLSTDGGKTYPYGYTVTGEMVMEFIATSGLDASWINTGVINLELLKLAGTICGLMQGYGATKDGTTTEGIVIYGNGVDSKGNARPPYLIVTSAGVRVQVTENYSFNMSLGAFQVLGNITATKAGNANGDITADGSVVSGNDVWMARNDPSGTHRLLAYTSDGTGHGLVARGGTNKVVYLGNTSDHTMLQGDGVSWDASPSSSSDRTLKKDIQPLPAGYERLLDGMEPVRFRYKREPDDGAFHLGYIAQDVEAALAAAGLDRSDLAALADIPQEDGGTKLGIAYGELIALLHMKINSLEAEIKQLKEEIRK